MNFLEFVRNKAAQCDWRISEVISDNLVVLTFDTDYGSEKCLIHPVGKNHDGNTILEFRSTSFEMATDRKVAGDLALFLLQRNATCLMGSWGLDSNDSPGNTYFLISLIANTMDTEEFRGAVRAILSERAWFHKFLQKNTVDF
jgi:hypothetical protein